MCKFYGWSLSDIKKMTLKEYNSALSFIIKYNREQAKQSKKAQNKMNKGKIR